MEKGLQYELQAYNYLILENPLYNVFLWKNVPLKYILNLKLDNSIDYKNYLNIYNSLNIHNSLNNSVDIGCDIMMVNKEDENDIILVQCKNYLDKKVCIKDLSGFSFLLAFSHISLKGLIISNTILSNRIIFKLNHIDKIKFIKLNYDDTISLKINNFIIPRNKSINLIISKDKISKDKILNAIPISSNEFDSIECKIKLNLATENEKYQYIQYKFKIFWNLKFVDKNNLDLYFDCEFTFNRLLKLLDKKNISEDEYTDYQIINKIKVITNIIETLGFDLTNLNIKILKDKYYSNVKLLFGKDNEFYKNYTNIRKLFNKDKHELKEDLKGPPLIKLLNGFLEEFGLKIYNKKTCNSVNKVITRNNSFLLGINNKYINKIDL